MLEGRTSLAGGTTDLPRLWLIAVVGVYLALAVASAWTVLPWCDEAWFSSPALNLLTKGYMGTSILDPTADFRTNNLAGIDRHTYWIPPLYPLTQAAWHRLVGFSIHSVRLYSVAWGLIAIGTSFLLMRTLSGDVRVALLTSAFLATDFTFLWSASVGRMDMMCAALGQAAFASFLVLRARYFGWALLISQSCVAASGLSHPMGLGYFVGLLFLTLYCDRSRIRPIHLAIAAIPYLIGALGWGMYIYQEPSAFYAQFHGNAADRFLLLSRPLETLRKQSVERYLYAYGLAPDTRGASHLKTLILGAYLLGLAGAFVRSRILRHAGDRLFLLLLAVCFLTFMAIDREIHFFYLVHFVMFLAPALALGIIWCWDRQSLPRWILLAALAAVVTVQLAVTGSRIAANPYRNKYLVTTAFLKQHASDSDLIMGSAELAFDLGFEKNLVDDYRLGFRSGKKPDFVVIDRNRYEEWIPLLQQQDPQAFRYIRTLMEHFQPVFDTGAYKIYAARAPVTRGRFHPQRFLTVVSVPDITEMWHAWTLARLELACRTDRNTGR